MAANRRQSRSREREQQALELRRAGVTFDVIAQQLGYANEGGAYKAYKRALIRALPAEIADLRLAELDRMDRLHAALWPKALKGDVAAADRVVRISQHRAALLSDVEAVGERERERASAGAPPPAPQKRSALASVSNIPRPA